MCTSSDQIHYVDEKFGHIAGFAVVWCIIDAQFVM